MPATRLKRTTKTSATKRAARTYLTKRMTVRAARSAGRHAAANAMEVMGFIVVSDGQNIIKKFSDGRIEIIGTPVR